MRIIYANDGIHTQDHMFLQFFLDRRHEVHLVSFCPKETFLRAPNFFGLPQLNGLKIHHFNIIPYPSISRFSLLLHESINVTALSHLVRKIKPDVLNGHYIPTYGFYSAMSLYHPFLLTIWDTDIQIYPRLSSRARARTKFVLKVADAVIVDSLVQKKAAEELGCPPEKIVSFPWAVDLNKFNPSVRGEKTRAKFGWSENLIIFCTRWHEHKYGIEYLLRAMPKVIENVPKARLLCGGQGILTRRFKEIVRASGIQEYVRFVGKIPHENMPEYMAASDIYVSVSLWDGTSATLLEAMACSKPVVVTNIPANREWIGHGKNGIIVPVRDSQAIASAISLLEDEKLRLSFGRRNWETVQKKANLNKSLELYEKTLQKLCN